MNILEFKKQFDPFLVKTLKDRIALSVATRGATDLDSLWDYPMTLAATGKRLRPYLVYLGYHACGGKNEADIFPVCVGSELFHTFCLVHDDVIDQDLERRGVASMHGYAAEWFKGKVREKDRARLGESIAILVGDSLFLWAKELLHDPKITPYVSKMIDEVIMGQGLDAVLAAKDKAVQKELDDMMFLKTAGYSFIRPLQIGGAFAGMSKEAEQLFSKFGTAFGIAFQLQDDYFDRESDAEKDRPSYYTRGYAEMGMERAKKLFEEAIQIVESGDLPPDIKKQLVDFVVAVRERKG